MTTTESKKRNGISRVGASIYSTLIKGDDGKKYWHCNRCNVEVEHKQRCRCCGKSIRERK